MVDYKSALNRLVSFRDSLPETGIKFLFFYASDMTKPKVKDVFRKWTTASNEYYVLPGVTPNTTYVYRESVIKYLVSSMVPTKRPHEYDVVIHKRTNRGDVNHGDHLDFGIIRKRDGSVLVKSHFTFYDDHSGNFNFTRSSKECNFTLDDANATLTCDDFAKKTSCEERTGPSKITMDLMYTEFIDRDIVHRLTNALLGNVVMGGGARRKFVSRGNRRYMVRYGKHGRKYITTPTGSVYLQKGGGGYKGVTFLTDQFVSFLTEWVLKPVADIRPDLSTIQVIFDEHDDACKDGNQNIVILYDFVDYTRHIFSIDAKMTIVACYGEHQQTVGLTEYEMSCVQQVRQIRDSIVRQVQQGGT